MGTSSAMGSAAISQLQPTIAAPASLRVATAEAGSTPIMVRKPRAAGLKAMLASTGRPAAADTTASTATRASVRSNIVSMLRRSTPPRTSASACSANEARRASGSASPMGLSIMPHGPMSPASRSRCATARPAAASLNSTARAAIPCASRRSPVPPKVLVFTMSEPADVEDIHRAFYAAGSDMVNTNTFGGTGLRLEAHGMAARAVEFNEAAAGLAVALRDREFPGRFVAGDIGPCGMMLKPMGDADPEALRASFAEQAEALVRGGVDLLNIETM